MPRHYPEANVWMSERDYRALAEEYQRIGDFVRAARETGGEGWEEANPDRTLSPGEQKRLAIRFGLASSGSARGNTARTKKSARKR